MKQTQAQSNPFPYSDSNKRYYTYDYYLRRTFGGKVAKVTLDAGFTCPNRDGTCGTGGCIYCSAEGSGEFAGERTRPLVEQFTAQVEKIKGKWQTERFIAYLQPFTNTYAPLERLRAVYEEALALPGVVGLNVATRADCLPDAVIALLDEISRRTVVTVELGLQTVHDKTAAAIRRGHDYAAFLDGYRRLREGAPHARVGIHLILGLFGENDENIMETAHRVAMLAPDEVKLHSLYVLEGTEMAEIFRNGAYLPLKMEHYVELVLRVLEVLPPDTVIGRLTGDAPRNALLAPLWSLKKGVILNEIDKSFYNKKSWQGKFFAKVL